MVQATRLKIGEIAKQTGVSVGTLRYYEDLRLIYPAERGNNGYRYYTPDTTQQVHFIKQAQVLGFSLDEIRRILDVRDRGELPCDLVRALLKHKIEYLDEQIQQMLAFKVQLEEYRDRWSTLNDLQLSDQVCPLIDSVSIAS